MLAWGGEGKWYSRLGQRGKETELWNGGEKRIG